MLEDRGIAQVSMNLTNYEKTPIFRVFEMVKREAARYGVAVLESEIVGLVPAAALVGAAEYYLQLERFGADQILENKLSETTSSSSSKKGDQNFFGPPGTHGGCVERSAHTRKPSNCPSSLQDSRRQVHRQFAFGSP